MTAPESRPGEAYRLRLAKRGADGMQHMLPFTADDRLFPTYREASAAARRHRQKSPSVVTQAVMLDSGGKVIFPHDDLEVRSLGRWHVAPTLWGGPAAKTGKKKKRRSPHAPRPGTGRPKADRSRP